MSGPPSSRPRRGLGRGLDALLSGRPMDAPGDLEADAAGDEGALIEVDPARVRPNPEQPRRHFDETALEGLAESIRTHGLLQPIVIERDDDGYRLVAGERRLRASRLAGVATVPAVLRPASDSGRHALELALVENLQRADLSPLEEAAAFARLADAFGLSHDAIALRVGRSRSAVTNTVRLLALPAAVQEALAHGHLTAGHARALLALPTDEEREALALEIVEHGMTVRQVEEAVQRRLAAASGAHASGTARLGTRRRRQSSLSPDDEALRRGFEEALGSPVRLERRSRGGRLLVEFADDEELDALYSRLGAPQL